MIAKTTVGSSFGGALNYGAGITLKGKKIEGKSELLLTHNLLSDQPNEMAREMHAEASYSKCESPVWHTSLSWPPDEKVSEEDMIKAANLYCEKIGADPKKHQIAIYRHFDQNHDHIHIYINRVSDGIALKTSHNYAQNVRVCKEISEELGFRAIPKRKSGKLRKVPEYQRDAQKHINKAIKKELKGKVGSVHELKRALEEKGITCNYKVEDDKLTSSSYQYDGVNIKGQDVGFTARKLNEELLKNKEKYLENPKKKKKIGMGL